uniref:MARVEL domain-containing protein n=1 Tax=Mesocestoides corti TaxID=53468 RepID=A0A5K3EH38_MESCO
MALNEVVMGCLTLSLVLYLLAVIIGAWPCGGLFRECQKTGTRNTSWMVYNYDIIGGLLIVCVITITISLVLTILSLLFDHSWIRVVSYCTCFIAFAIGITMEICFHTRINYDWSSFLNTVGMTLCFQVFLVQVAELIHIQLGATAHFTPEFM